MKTKKGKPIESLTDAQLALCASDSERDKALQVGNVLQSLGMTEEVITAGFLARLYLADPSQSLPASDKVLSILQDLEHLNLIDQLHDIDDQDFESLRRMLLSIVKDVRVVIVKLALELVNLRYLDELSETKRQQHAGLAKDIFAPLANRLGIAKIKWEMEDLALRNLEPQIYKMIASSLSEQRDTREKYVNDAIVKLTSALADVDIEAPKIYGRVKHINSIYAKMRKKNKHLEQIYDLLAIRVQVETIEQCYTVLDTVHDIWTPITSEFDDYIANPKPNGYQSLHTAVKGPSGKTIEIQVRTNDMHQFAELGVAAHWKYKEGSTDKETAFDKQINWLRQILAESDESLVEEFKNEILEDRVYVITPQGKVINLPDGATPLDFAYYIHTELGHRCRGAMINERLVPINYTLKTGETVEVLTSPQGKPSRDWLNPQSGFIKTARARSKARGYFRKLARENALVEGRNDLDALLKKFELLNDKTFKATLVEKFNVDSMDGLSTAVGLGDISLARIERVIEVYLKSIVPPESLKTRLANIPIKPYREPKGSVTIDGIDDLFISLASCCRPIAPDKIVGFITKTKGVSIHKHDCMNLAHLKDVEPERILEVSWALGAKAFSASIEVRAEDRVGLIKDIMNTLSAEKVMLNKAEFLKEDQKICVFQLGVTVANHSQLQRLLSKLSRISGILGVNNP